MSALMRYISDISGKLSDTDVSRRISDCGPWSKAFLAAAGVCGTYLSADFIYTQYKKRANDKKRDDKRRENENSIKDLRLRLAKNKPSVADVKRITRLSMHELTEELKTGKIRPIEVLRAYQAQALQAHDKTNCLVEAIVEAEERAFELEKGPRDGLLWGVPFSTKDDIGIKGYDSTIGMVVNIGMKAQNNAAVVEMMLNQGAIPFVKTNVPQTLMSIEPGNPINGTVRHPHAINRSPGGSSSGEGALIASCGSPLGIGGDIAGSIRVPAHFCGIKGFTPTANRMTFMHVKFDGPTLPRSLQPTWGPLSREVDGLVLMMRSVWQDCMLSQRDSSVPWQPFDEREYASNRKLRIGYFTDNPLFPTFSACKRAVRETVELLASQGHEVVSWQPPRIEDTMDIGFGLMQIMCDSTREALLFDRVDPTIQDYYKGHMLPNFIRRFLDMIIRPVSPWMADQLAHNVGLQDTLTYMKLAYELELLRRCVHDSWRKAGLDAVICPPSIMVAPPFGNATMLTKTWIYTFYFNLLQFPSGVLDTTKVIQADLNKLDYDFPDTGDAIHRGSKAAMMSSLGLPVGVMVSTVRYRDELCLRVMKIIEDNQSN